MSTSPGIFIARNSAQQIIISSETNSLHYVGKATNISNTASSYSNTYICTFRITSSKVPIPFFTMPAGYTYAVSALRNVGINTWDIDIMKTGATSGMPEVYIFTDPGAVVPSSEPNGLIVYKDDGVGVSFDSRREPLVITNGTTISYPYTPRSPLSIPQGAGYWHDNCGARYYTEGYFTPNQENTYSIGALPTKPMYLVTSLAQATQTARSQRIQVDDYWIYKETRVWISSYWSFYRGGIRVSGNTLYASWMEAFSSCNPFYQLTKAFLGFDYGGYQVTGALPAYSNETINLTNIPVIIADGSIYD